MEDQSEYKKSVTLEKVKEMLKQTTTEKIAKEFLEERLGVDGTHENILRFVNYITRFEEELQELRKCENHNRMCWSSKLD